MSRSEEFRAGHGTDDRVLLHRGVADYDGRDLDGNRHTSAESWHAEAQEDHPGFGTWWSRDPQMASFYGEGSRSGVVVSAKFPAEKVRESKSSGVKVEPGTEGEVHRVEAQDRDGRFVLPHRPGFRIRA